METWMKCIGLLCLIGLTRNKWLCILCYLLHISNGNAYLNIQMLDKWNKKWRLRTTTIIRSQHLLLFIAFMNRSHLPDTTWTQKYSKIQGFECIVILFPEQLKKKKDELLNSSSFARNGPTNRPLVDHTLTAYLVGDGLTILGHLKNSCSVPCCDGRW